MNTDKYFVLFSDNSFEIGLTSFKLRFQYKCRLVAGIQPVDQGVLASLKRHYRKALIRKLPFEGDSASGIVSMLEFWKAVNV